MKKYPMNTCHTCTYQGQELTRYTNKYEEVSMCKPCAKEFNMDSLYTNGIHNDMIEDELEARYEASMDAFNDRVFDEIEYMEYDQADRDQLVIERAHHEADMEETRRFMEEMRAKGISEDLLPF